MRLFLLLLVALPACALTSHATQPSRLGINRDGAALLAVLDQPGPILVETVDSADWQVPRSGLIDLDHPRARQAGLTDSLEPISVFFHALRHPTRGLYIVDSGVERALRDAPAQAAVRGVIARYLHVERMHVQNALGDWLAARPGEPLQGVLLTHLHLDHVSGLPDAPAGVPLYVGAGDAADRAARNLFVKPNIDRALAGKGPINEWPAAPDGSGLFKSVVDVFGDGSLWALATPGHTPGSTAYLARTPDGPVLFTGDTCHTVWGWQHDVEPGSYTADARTNVDSLARLRALVKAHPAIRVVLGHQTLPASVPTVAAR